MSGQAMNAGERATVEENTGEGKGGGGEGGSTSRLFEMKTVGRRGQACNPHPSRS